MGMPTGVSSKKPSGRMPEALTSPATVRFVLVPTSVMIPPRIVA
jgi:hypothetical protein